MFKVSDFKFTTLERQAVVSCAILTVPWPPRGCRPLLPGPAFCRCWVLWATCLPAGSPAAPRLWGWGAPGWQEGRPGVCLKVGVFLRNLWACGSHPLCHRPWCVSRVMSSRSNWELVREGTGGRLPELLPGGCGPSALLGGWPWAQRCWLASRRGRTPPVASMVPVFKKISNTKYFS